MVVKGCVTVEKNMEHGARSPQKLLKSKPCLIFEDLALVKETGCSKKDHHQGYFEHSDFKTHQLKQ